MRAMFGLVSLLVVIAIMLVLFKWFEAPVLEQGQKTRDQARQISGRGDDGVAAIHSFQVEPNLHGNKLESLDVTDVTPGGALASYGLQKGDKIIDINGTKVGDLSNNDSELAKAQVHDAFQRSQSLVVLRNGQPVTLPQGASDSAGANGPLNSINNSIKIPTH